MSAQNSSLSWLGIIRLGLVQAALGSVVVLVTSTLNRVMVVEYALPAVLPAALVALHYAVQLVRPRFGHQSDIGGRRTPWIIGGMAILAAGGVLCAAATVLITHRPGLAVPLEITAYAMVGIGVGAAGTSLLALLAKRVAARRRAAAATIMWVLMIAGFAVTSTTVGHFLDPFSASRLIRVTAVVAALAFTVAVLAVGNVEGKSAAIMEARVGPAGRGSFGIALQEMWSEPQSRRFTLFVFTSMLAYSAQELLLEPFAGMIFGYTLGESARLSGLWHAAVMTGMITIGFACSGVKRFGSLRAWTVGGCAASAVALLCLAGADLIGPPWPIRMTVMALGASNGVFAVAAIGSMMELAQVGDARKAGMRMGLWGAAQAIAFACGGVMATGVVDLVRYLFGSTAAAFAVVFGLEAILFLVAALFAFRVSSHPRSLSTSTHNLVTV